MYQVLRKGSRMCPSAAHWIKMVLAAVSVLKEEPATRRLEKHLVPNPCMHALGRDPPDLTSPSPDGYCDMLSCRPGRVCHGGRWSTPTV